MDITGIENKYYTDKIRHSFPHTGKRNEDITNLRKKTAFEVAKIRA
jgi:hypothetical protein